MNTAIITGITGQDGSYLAEFLLEKKYKVVGVFRRSSINTTERISHLLDNENLILVEGDITDYACMANLIRAWQPVHLYNLAAQSHVKTSFEQPLYTFQVDAVGVLNCLEAIRMECPTCKFYQASTSELYGSNYDELEDGSKVQSIDTELLPNSPYGVAKLAAHNLVRVYREAYGIFAVAGILHNHESPRRPEAFVTRKITAYVARLSRALEKGKTLEPLHLGNLDASRDWSHAKDMVKAMYLMLQQDQPKDYVVCSGEARTIKEFCDIAFKYIGENWEDHVVVDPKFFRPLEVDYLRGDCGPIKELGWNPEYSFEDLIGEMLLEDIKRVQ